MTNPLLEARAVRAGTRLVFRHSGEVVDPIRRQLLFDFDSVEMSGRRGTASEPASFPGPGRTPSSGVYETFLAAVKAEERGEKQQAIALYDEILIADPSYAPACINLGTLHFHLRDFDRAERLYRLATEVDPNYVLAYFDLGNVLDELNRQDESIAAYKKAVALSPRYADAHYNLALAYERTNQYRAAMRHWQCYLKVDNCGPWADHARSQIHKLLSREKISIAARATCFIPHHREATALTLVQD